MEVKLIVAGGKSAGRVVPVAGPKFFIGRSEDCQLRPASDLVSRHHCVILVEDGYVCVRDFDSKNGTFVNGERIKREQELKSGDRLQVGALVFEVQLSVAMAGKQRPKVHSVEEAASRTAAAPAAKGGTDDVDLSNWLGDDEAAGKAVAADTRPVKADPSETVAEKPAPRPQPAPKPQPEEIEGVAKKKEEKPGPAHGKSAARPMGMKKPKAADSQSAAADTLRQLFGRR